MDQLIDRPTVSSDQLVQTVSSDSDQLVETVSLDQLVFLKVNATNSLYDLTTGLSYVVASSSNQILHVASLDNQVEKQIEVPSTSTYQYIIASSNELNLPNSDSDTDGYDFDNNDHQIGNTFNFSSPILDQHVHVPDLEKDKQGRKRKREPEKWIRSIRQKARNNGLLYVTRKGKTVPAKNPKPVDCNKCRFTCNSVISEEDRVNDCQEYYSLQDYNVKKQFLCSLVNEEPINRPRSRCAAPDPKKKKTKSCAYYLFSNDGLKKRVCQDFFCKTFSFSFRCVDSALAGKGDSGAFVGTDKRKGGPAHNKISEDIVKHIHNHINTFPKVLPHYCRKNSNKQYLSPDLNIKQMYRLYRDDYCVRLNLPPVKEHKYRQIFTNDFNLRCFKPKKNQCSVCNAYSDADEARKLTLKVAWDQHKQREKESMEEKYIDKQRAHDDKSFLVVTFDLEAVLVTPHAGDAQIYYKRKLAVYNFTLFETASHQGYCYLWDETEGGRGANEIGSALLDYLGNLPSTVKHVTTFSDTCSGQNRNLYVASAMLYAVQNLKNIEIIGLKFMESGHSYLEADSMHATIEKAFRHKKVYTT